MFERGKHQYETMLCMLVVLIVMLAFYFWIGKLAVATERAKVDYDVSNIRGAMHILELSKIIAGKQDELKSYSDMNPMDLMQLITELPTTYIGEYEGDKDIPNGSWFFNSKTKNLVYKVINKRLLSDGDAYFYFKVKYEDARVKGLGAGRLKLLQQKTDSS